MTPALDQLNDSTHANTRSEGYYFLKLPQIEFKSYVPQILDYYNNIYPTVPKEITEATRNVFWNPVPPYHVKQYFPQLIDAVTPTLGKIRQVTILALYNNQSALHTDHTIGLNKSVQARVNIPLQNTDNTTTAFYNIAQEFPFKTSPGGTISWPATLASILKPAAQTSVNDYATVLRTSHPHIVLCDGRNGNEITPRLTLTISFDQDVVHLLNKD